MCIRDSPQAYRVSAGGLRFHTYCVYFNENDSENLLYIPDRVIFGDPYSSKITELRLRRAVAAAAVTTHAKPHAQQQLVRDLEVERAVMGQRYRPQRSGPGLLSAAARFGFVVVEHNVSLLEGLDFTPAASASTKLTLKTFFPFRTE